MVCFFLFSFVCVKKLGRWLPYLTQLQLVNDMVKMEFGSVSFTLSHGKKLYQQKQMVTVIHFQVLNARSCLWGPIPLTQWDSSGGLIVTQRMEQQPPHHHQGKAEQRREQTCEAVSSFIILLYMWCLTSLQSHFRKPNSEYSVTYCFKVRSQI